MPVIVDTPIWSLGFRRRSDSLSTVQRSHVLELGELIRRKEVLLMGSVRQEVLSGIRDEKQFQKVFKKLEWLGDEPIEPIDYVAAARSANRCYAAGLASSSTDILICALALRLDVDIWTTDKDFELFARVLPIRLYKATSISDI